MRLFEVKGLTLETVSLAVFHILKLSPELEEKPQRGQQAEVNFIYTPNSSLDGLAQSKCSANLCW